VHGCIGVTAAVTVVQPQARHHEEEQECPREPETCLSQTEAKSGARGEREEMQALMETIAEAVQA
jgi:hypothetical protein